MSEREKFWSRDQDDEKRRIIEERQRRIADSERSESERRCREEKESLAREGQIKEREILQLQRRQYEKSCELDRSQQEKSLWQQQQVHWCTAFKLLEACVEVRLYFSRIWILDSEGKNGCFWILINLGQNKLFVYWVIYRRYSGTPKKSLKAIFDTLIIKLPTKQNLFHVGYDGGSIFDKSN